jgi:hypothetical protein
MERAQVHYEVLIRRQHNAGWALEQATEDRAKALALAEEMLADRRAVAVRVTKETLNAQTREFLTVTILDKGEPERVRARKQRDDVEPICVSPQDLYTGHARERIGRLLDTWLARNKATPFELLHRADLVEQLEASDMDLQHAIQKIAVPEAQARGGSVHEHMRAFKRLAQAAIDRVLKDARKGLLPKTDVAGFAALAERIATAPERQYLLGAAVAGVIAGAASWSGKVNLMLDLADAAPQSQPARALALQVLEQPLAEVLGSTLALNELLGSHLDLGGFLAALTRLSAAETVELLIGVEPAVARMMPPLEGAAARLANWLDGPHFEAVRRAIARRVLKELTGPRRLRPKDTDGEIEVLRVLAMGLTAASGRLMSLDDVQNAFVERSRMLVREDFVEAYLGDDRTPLAEVEALIWLAENVTGAANKRQASRWVGGKVTALRFETDQRQSSESAAVKLAALARLQRGLSRAGFTPEDAAPIATRIGEVGGLIEAEAQLTGALARAGAPVVHRLTLLLGLAVGESAPLGPAADRAKLEVVKLMRIPETRTELAQTPESVERVRSLLKNAGLAA